jgi:prolyl-tRNA editing enzyme YbaK/EbsC (Cys-tRNA(Pro) deacylase)
MKERSVDRVRRVLFAAGHKDTITEFPEGTRSAQDAASAVGSTVAQIVKSMIFRCGDVPVLVLTSGVNRVDEPKVSEIIGQKIEPANGRWVREVTGFAIGGVAPIGHKAPLKILIDEDLLRHKEIWAAAGSPMLVFSTTPDQLQAMTGGVVADIKQD